MHLACPDAGLPGSSAIVSGTIPTAVGSALSFDIQQSGAVSVAFFGDGATNEGVFYESLNFASLKKLPVVFVCENNLYATHMPIDKCLADTRIYRKAEVFNMPGTRVDGNDVLEVFQTARQAIEAARSGQGPALIECMTYRWRGHVGPSYDVDRGLRSQEELDYWMSKCPIERLEQFFSEHDIMSKTDMKQALHEVDREVKEALTRARDASFPNDTALRDNA